MSKKDSQRGGNGSAGPNGHVNGNENSNARSEQESPQPRNKNGKPPKVNGSSGKDNGVAVDLLRPTEAAAMQDGAAYFDAVAARVDLVGASVRLITAKDLKISKSELDRLREMKFGKAGVAVEEILRVEPGDIPRPPR